MKAYTADLIECAAGWQAELNLPGNWHVYSRVYPTQDQVREQTSKLAKLMGWTIVFNEQSEQEPRP